MMFKKNKALGPQSGTEQNHVATLPENDNADHVQTAKQERVKSDAALTLALNVVVKALAATPHDCALLLELAQIQWQRRQVSAAERAVRQILAITPQHEAALVFSIQLYQAKGDNKQALVVANTLTDLFPQNIAHWNRRFELSRIHETKAQQFEIVLKARSFHEQDINFMLCEAEYLAARAENDAALDLFSKVTEQFPKNKRALLGSARIALETGNGEAFEQLLSITEKWHANSPEVALLRVENLIAHENAEDALQVLAAALERTPEKIELLYAQAATTEKLSPPKAVALWQRIALFAGDVPEPRWLAEAHAALARAHALTGNWQASAASYTEACYFDPKNYEWFYQQGLALFEAENYAASFKAVEKACALNAKFLPARLLMGLSALRLKDIKRVKDVLATLNEKFPQAPETLQLAAKLDLYDRKVLDAVALSAKALAKAQDCPKQTIIFASILARSGSFTPAVALLDHVAQTNPELAVFRYKQNTASSCCPNQP